MKEHSNRSDAALFSYDRLSHAYIAQGHQIPDLAAAAVCSSTDKKPCGICKDCQKAARQIHPDITTVVRQKDDHGKLRREIIVAQIRALKTDLYIAPNEAVRKVYIINEAEKMNTEAQNAFLQMLEEPPAHVVFILNTSNPAALLPTVRSRCINIQYRIQSLSQPDNEDSSETGDEDDDMEAIRKLAFDFVRAQGDNLALTRCMFNLDKLDRSGYAGFLALSREGFAKVLRENPRNSNAARADDLLIQALEMLDLNVSVGHISGMLCSSLMKDDR